MSPVYLPRLLRGWVVVRHGPRSVCGATTREVVGSVLTRTGVVSVPPLDPKGGVRVRDTDEHLNPELLWVFRDPSPLTGGP